MEPKPSHLYWDIPHIPKGKCFIIYIYICIYIYIFKKIRQWKYERVHRLSSDKKNAWNHPRLNHWSHRYTNDSTRTTACSWIRQFPTWKFRKTDGVVIIFPQSTGVYHPFPQLKKGHFMAIWMFGASPSLGSQGSKAPTECRRVRLSGEVPTFPPLDVRKCISWGWINDFYPTVLMVKAHLEGEQSWHID